MKNLSELFGKTYEQEIYEQMLKVQQDHDLTDKLLKMQLQQDVNPQEAEQNAEACIRAVVTCETVSGHISEDAPAAMQEFFSLISGEEDREMILLKVLFGLTAYRDEQMAWQLCNGVSQEYLFFHEYYQKNAGLKSEETLEQEILEALNTYRLSDTVLEAIIGKMKSTGDYLATVSALGEGGIQYKCIMTMDAYLKGKGTLSMDEAAREACCSADVQATADGLGKRMLKRSVAKKILIAVGVTVVVLGAGYAIYHAGAAAGFLKAAAEATDFVMPVSKVFADIASMGGAVPAVTRFPAKMYSDIFLESAAAQKHLRNIGYAVTLAGVACVALSSKAADFIGGLDLGFTRDKQSHLEGLESLKGTMAENQKQDSWHIRNNVPVKKTVSQKQIVKAGR